METYGTNDIYGNSDESSQPSMLLYSSMFFCDSCMQAKKKEVQYSKHAHKQKQMKIASILEISSVIFSQYGAPLKKKTRNKTRAKEGHMGSMILSMK